MDYQSQSDSWQTELLERVKPLLQAADGAATNVVSINAANLGINSNTGQEYDKQNPYSAEVIVSQKLTGRDSLKDIRHLEIDLGESAISYQAGDALGVYFHNDETLVAEILEALALEPDTRVQLGAESLELRDA